MVANAGNGNLVRYSALDTTGQVLLSQPRHWVDIQQTFPNRTCVELVLEGFVVLVDLTEAQLTSGGALASLLAGIADLGAFFV